MNNAVRRTISLLLACVLCLGFAPAAMAEEPSSSVTAGYSDSGPDGTTEPDSSVEQAPPVDASPAPNMALPPEFLPPGDRPPQDPMDPMKILLLRPEYYGQVLPLPVGTLPELPGTILCLTEANSFLDCPVEWDTAGLQNAGPGRFGVPGRLILPEGYHLSDALGLDSVDPYPLFFYQEGMEQEVLLSINVPFFSGGLADPVYRLEKGGDLASLPFWDALAVCRTTQFEEFTLPVRWDAGEFQSDRPGLYTIQGVIDLPPGFSPPEDFAPLSVGVEVGEPQPVMLTNPRLEDGKVVCGIVGEVKDLEWMRSEFLPDLPEEEWRDCMAKLDSSDGKMHGIHVIYDSGLLTILSGMLDPGETVSFRLRYQGVYTNILHVHMTEDGALEYELEGDPSDQPPPKDPFEDPDIGDHGGGDRDDQELPPLRQPAPGNAQENAPENPPDVQSAMPPVEQPAPIPAASPPPVPDEQSTDTGVILSGARVGRLIKANPKTVLIEKHGVAIELPSEFLDSLGLSDRSLLEVTIEPVGENGFHLAVHANGRAVTELPPTRVRLPLKNIRETGVPLACYDAQGYFVCDAVWDPALGVATVVITRTGEYSVREKEQKPPAAIPVAARPEPATAPEPPAPPEQPDSPGLPPLAFAALPALGGCLWLLLRRKGGRRHG